MKVGPKQTRNYSYWKIVIQCFASTVLAIHLDKSTSFHGHKILVCKAPGPGPFANGTTSDVFAGKLASHRRSPNFTRAEGLIGSRA